MKAILRAMGRNIRRRRMRLGLTQEELSDRVGIHYTFLGHIERGTKAPSLHTLWRIAKALIIPLPALLRDDEPR